MVNWNVEDPSTAFPSLLFYLVEMIAEIDTDESGTVDFDGECMNFILISSKPQSMFDKL